MSKTVNFGIAYGMWTQGLMGNLTKAGINAGTEEAERIIKGYHKAYPQVSKYLFDISEEGCRNFEVRNKAGRVLKFDKPKDKKEKEEA